MSVKPWTQFNCYETLGVGVDATDEELRSAYREASRRAHPDQGGSHEQQVRVNLAYEILRQPDQRQRHDRHWRLGDYVAEGVAPAFSDPSALKDLWSGAGRSNRELSDREGSSGLARRVQSKLKRDQSRITLDREHRQATWEDSFAIKLKRARFEGGVALVGVLATLWIATVYIYALVVTVALGYVLGRRLRGVSFEGERISIADPQAQRKLTELAEGLANASVERDCQYLAHYDHNLTALTRLILGATKPTHSEVRVVKRLVAILFVLGYRPVSHEPESKLLYFQGEREEAVLSYQHDAPRPLGIAPVEKLLAQAGGRPLFLYHRAGLTKKAAECAENRGVRWVGLAELDDWACGVWNSPSSGPPGDIVQQLADLPLFLERLS